MAAMVQHLPTPAEAARCTEVQEEDVPFNTTSRRQYVDTQTIADAPIGSTVLHVHCNEGIMAGQALSIGTRGIDDEHVTVAGLGSVLLTAQTTIHRPCATALSSALYLSQHSSR